MNESLPFKEPAPLMAQPLEMTPALDITDDLKLSDIQSEDHAVSLYKEADNVRAVVDKVQRLTVTYLMQSNSQEQVAEKLDVSLSHIKQISGRAAFVGLRDSRQVHRDVPQQIADPEVLNDLLPSQRDVEAYKRLPQEDREAIAAATNVKTKAQQLLEAARERKAEAESRWQKTDLYKETHAQELAERREKGREGLISKTFKDIGYGLQMVIEMMDKSTDKKQVEADLKRLANQLAAAGIYPDNLPNE